jgi:hypothetical protein
MTLVFVLGWAVTRAPLTVTVVTLIDVVGTFLIQSTRWTYSGPDSSRLKRESGAALASRRSLALILACQSGPLAGMKPAGARIVLVVYFMVVVEDIDVEVVVWSRTWVVDVVSIPRILVLDAWQLRTDDPHLS